MDKKLLFQGIDHFGINSTYSGDYKKNTELLSTLFNLKITDGKDSVYAGNSVEFMKNTSGYGKCGHLAVATGDIEEAMAQLEEMGYEFYPESSKYDDNGRLTVIYLKLEIAGFAVHLLQK